MAATDVFSEEEKELVSQIEELQRKGDLVGANNANLKLCELLFKRAGAQGSSSEFKAALESRLSLGEELKRMITAPPPPNRTSKPSTGKAVQLTASAEAPKEEGYAKDRQPPAVALSGSFCQIAVPPSGSSQAGGQPVNPRGAPIAGGNKIRWSIDGPPPQDLYLGGRPCAELEDGWFIVPICRLGTSTVEVKAVWADGKIQSFPDAFAYFAPGTVLSVDPTKGPLTGGPEICVNTTDLAEVISNVLVAGKNCEIVGDPSFTSCRFKLPPHSEETEVDVEIHARNGNHALAKAAFMYFAPDVFDMIGENAQLSEGGLASTRAEGVCKAVSILAYKLREFPQGKYFEFEISKMGGKGMCAFACGVVVKPTQEALDKKTGRLKCEDAQGLSRAWIAGYDHPRFMNDGQEEKIPTSTWRPQKDVKLGDRIGILWTKDKPRRLVIYQNGVKQLSLQASGQLPEQEEDLHGLVDIQGQVTTVTLVEGARPPSGE